MGRGIWKQSVAKGGGRTHRNELNPLFKRIVEAHSGRIKVLETPGKGAIFRALIPVVAIFCAQGNSNLQSDSYCPSPIRPPSLSNLEHLPWRRAPGIAGKSYSFICLPWRGPLSYLDQVCGEFKGLACGSSGFIQGQPVTRPVDQTFGDAVHACLGKRNLPQQ
jgi:hypothetical protein